MHLVLEGRGTRRRHDEVSNSGLTGASTFLSFPRLPEALGYIFEWGCH
jgi:hypothetical protein